MSIQADLLNPELGYSDEGFDLSDPAFYADACRPFRSATMLRPVAYRSKTFLELESEKLWTRSWVPVGLQQQVPNPGDLLPFTLGFHGLHVQRNGDASLAARLNRHQHGGCRFVPVQCRTGMQTKCSIVSCNYTRDSDAIAADLGGSNSDAMFKFIGLVPEKLQPVRFGVWGPFIMVNLDPECYPLDDYVYGLDGGVDVYGLADLPIRHKLWIDAQCNWKELGAAFLESGTQEADTDVTSFGEVAFVKGRMAPGQGLLGNNAEDIELFWVFPNMLVAKAHDHSLVVILQSTGPGKTLCRLFFLAGETLADDDARRQADAWVAYMKACSLAAEATHLDHVLHGTASRPGTDSETLPVETSYGSYLLNRFVAAKVCVKHTYYWTAPVMDAAMLMRGVR